MAWNRFDSLKNVKLFFNLQMKSSVFLVILWVMQWECNVHAQGWGGCCNCYAERVSGRG